MKKIQIVPLSKREEMKKYFFDYLKELSQFDKTITFDKNGTPIYNWFDAYWKEKSRYPFYLLVDDNVAGIALIREVQDKQYEIAEFYILPTQRKDDNAIWFANNIISLFDGEFSFSTDRVNHRAVKFWQKFAKMFKNVLSNEDETRMYWIIRN